MIFFQISKEHQELATAIASNKSIDLHRRVDEVMDALYFDFVASTKESVTHLLPEYRFDYVTIDLEEVFIDLVRDYFKGHEKASVTRMLGNQELDMLQFFTDEYVDVLNEDE